MVQSKKKVGKKKEKRIVPSGIATFRRPSTIRL
jgi:hypothetical protein